MYQPNNSGGNLTTGMTLSGSGNVGIGTSTPVSKFAIQANNGDTDTSLFTIGSSTANVTTTLFGVSNTGLITGQNFSLANGTTSAFAITGITSSLLKTDASGDIIPAAAGTDYVTPAALTAATAFSFMPVTFGATAANATSTLMGFTNGLYALASSTIGNGAQGGGLTISGGATSTGFLTVTGTTGTTTIASGQGFTIGGSQLVVQQGSGNVGIGTANPVATLTTTVSSTPSLADGNTNLRLEYAGGPGLNSLGAQITFAQQWQASSPTNIVRVGAIAGYKSAGNSNFGGGLQFMYQPNNSGGNLTTGMTLSGSGNVGIGTSTPYTRLSVWGADTASSTLAFNIVNNASTTVFAVFDGGNAQLSDTLTPSSDARLKTNIQSLDASTSLAAINSLIPVAYDWLDPNKGGIRQYGFIAQQVEPVFPDLVSTTSATALTPDGTLGLNYIGLIAPIVKAVQALSAELSSIESTIGGFADHFTTNELTFTRAQGDELDVKKLCVGLTCVTEPQLKALLAIVGQSGSSSSGSSPSIGAAATDTPPVIQINGNNPAHINIGDAYADLGALITGPQADLNLGIKTFLNGTLTSNIVVDTSSVATDTIDYVVTDQNGLSATSTRTIIVEAATSSVQ